eukprot:gb/GEZN01007655.1/.p1 GENE.gb/GEZN01007655.1/~~gb/GEZN01007655.1/.p1  ORF type:complete len:394 (-),score=43.78 gb/GEZN01007655.1/:306-1487(-)
MSSDSPTSENEPTAQGAGVKTDPPLNVDQTAGLLSDEEVALWRAKAQAGGRSSLPSPSISVIPSEVDAAASEDHERSNVDILQQDQVGVSNQPPATLRVASSDYFTRIASAQPETSVHHRVFTKLARSCNPGDSTAFLVVAVFLLVFVGIAAGGVYFVVRGAIIVGSPWAYSNCTVTKLSVHSLPTDLPSDHGNLFQLQGLGESFQSSEQDLTAGFRVTIARVHQDPDQSQRLAGSVLAPPPPPPPPLPPTTTSTSTSTSTATYTVEPPYSTERRRQLQVSTTSNTKYCYIDAILEDGEETQLKLSKNLCKNYQTGQVLICHWPVKWGEGSSYLSDSEGKLAGGIFLFIGICWLGCYCFQIYTRLLKSCMSPALEQDGHEMEEMRGGMEEGNE